MVAPSFQKMKQLGDPFEVSGKMYVAVLNEKTGTERTVRWYSEAEYNTAYPSSSVKPQVVVSVKEYGGQRAALGFTKGPITIFKNVEEDDEDYFRLSLARYCTWWGWYLTSEMEPLADLPDHIIPISLEWDAVGTPSNTLKPEAQVREAIDALIFDSHGVSEYVGTLGERREFTLTVVKNISFDSGYGTQHLHTFNDEAGNEFIWSTSSKSWNVGDVKHIRATIKDYKLYKGVKQTVLTRCAEVGK